jgi:tRNA uridine 5-carbamoylmethylation protein Kti12
MTLVVNLFASPGSGKSTMAAGLFYRLKSKNVNCELTGEIAKDWVWEGRNNVLDDQIYVFAKQQRRVLRLNGKVDVAICDSPTIMGLVYMDKSRYPNCFGELVDWQFNQYENVNFLLERTKPYNPKGRNQSEEESVALHADIKQLMTEYNIPYQSVQGNAAGLDMVEAAVLERLRVSGRVPSVRGNLPRRRDYLRSNCHRWLQSTRTGRHSSYPRQDR